MATLDAQAPDGKTLSINVPEGTPEAAYPKMVEEAMAHYTSLPSGLESFGRAAVNNLPAGGQIGALGTAALKGEDYSQGMQEFNQKASDAKAAHPVAYGAGAVAGTMAPLAIPGVGEAMAAAPAATGAALGAANAVGNTDVTQNPGEAVKQGLEGAATGAVLGKMLPTGKGASEELENYANREAVKGLGLKPGVLGIPKEDLEDLGQFAHETGLTKGPLEQRVNTVNDLLQQTGHQIGDMGGGAPLADASQFIDTLHNKLQESASIFGPEGNPETNVYRQAIANLSQPNMTFDQLQQLKTAVGNRAFDSVGEVKNDAAAAVYGVYKDAMKSIVEGSPAEYQDAMTTYGKLKDIQQGLTNQFQKEQATGLQAKGFGLAGKMGGMITGGNVPATASLAAAAAPFHPFMAAGLATTITQNPQAMESAARGLSAAVPGVAAAAKLGGIAGTVSHFINNMSSYGKYAAPLSQALQAGGAQGFAATSFVLRQQHPELNDIMMQKESEEKQ